MQTSRVRRGRRAVLDEHDPAALIAVMVAAERATATGSDHARLGRDALALSGADAVWMAARPGAEPTQAGSRLHDHAARALIASGLEPARLRREGGLYGRGLADRAAVVFVYDDDGPDRSALADAIADWLGLRFAARSADAQAERAARAELRALRAQISPHFSFNAMGAIAALIRIDPERAHSLLLDFADYLRYSFGRHGEYTTLAEELRAIEIYLSLERARFGERLSVHVSVPPDVLNVPVPFLVLQPLVENAIRHGIEPLPRGGTVRVVVQDEGASVRIVVEDDGAGADPDRLEDLLAAAIPADVAGREHVGLRNVDERLRAVYGDEFGLVASSAPGAGTRIVLTIPKYRAGVLA